MILESLGIATLGVIAYKVNFGEQEKYKKLINELPVKNKTFSNAAGQGVKFLKYYNNKILIDVAGVVAADKIEEQKGFLKSYFRVKDVRLNDLENGRVEIELIHDQEFNKKYEVVPQEAYQVMTGYVEGRPNLVNMNSFPHMLIGGDTGTGKSKFLMMLLTNLIANCDVDIYIMQIRKSDLIIFKDCKQCKFIARDLIRARNLLKYLNDLCIKRDAEIEKHTLDKGIYNIEDYNNYFKNNKMKYAYVIMEEFSFFTPNGADSKEEKELKKEILGYIKQIVNSSRSSGIFIITSLQKPTSSSIPTDIKSQLTTRVCFKMLDKETSIIILGNGQAVKLKPRTAIVRSLNQSNVNIPFINHNAIIEAIKHTIETNKKYIKINNTENTKNDGVVKIE